MNLYPHNIEEKLGFIQVRKILHEGCITSAGRDLVNELEISDNLIRIRESVSKAAEMKNLIIQGEKPPEVEFEEIDEFIKYASIEGSMLTLDQLYAILIVLNVSGESLKFINKNRSDCPFLYEKFGSIQLDKELKEQLDRCIDERGQLKDTASKELQRLRRQAVKYEQQARNKLSQYFGKAKKDGYTPDGSSITVRSGRLVLPVLSEHKKKIRGLVHDMSSTGNTLFIEPEEVLELNNELRECQYMERREINRILNELTVNVRNSNSLNGLSAFLGEVDFIRSKAKLSLKLGSVKPEFEDQPINQWFNARHPLLDISFKNLDKAVVPQNFTIGNEQRIILVSGPNAGGKSVCLKTLGLIQYMAQCGLEIPVEENSIVGIYKSIFIDIGDEQSLENDLSTYSSHLLNMKYYMNFSNENTLLLIDEFGTGTDPDYGGAIAEAVLLKLIDNGAKGMITTHYGNLKQFAENHAGVVNGAMQFDSSKLEPKYKLEVGKPGSSFALEIAAKIGLDQDAINMAKDIIGTEKVQLDELISSLEKEKITLENKLASSNILNLRLEKDIEKYNELRERLEDEEGEIINKAKEEAQSLLNEANVQIERTIREIKESSAEKSRTRNSRGELKEFEKKLVKKKPARKYKKRVDRKTQIIDGEIRINDQVRIAGQDTKGTVMQIKGKSAEILIGELRSTIKLDRLEKIGIAGDKKSQKAKIRSHGLDLNKKMAEFKPEIDIRGKRVEEVLPELERYMDNALMFNISQLRIVHGKGNGVLREVVRNYLKEYSGIKTVSDEHADRGGSGVTIIHLK